VGGPGLGGSKTEVCRSCAGGAASKDQAQVNQFRDVPTPVGVRRASSINRRPLSTAWAAACLVQRRALASGAALASRCPVEPNPGAAGAYQHGPREA